ncbi:MAG: PaaI family thioesterase [Gammaproteobacteria bacterium]|jgi:acyl-coenzyme A thioesterase PaaI-like protein
MDQTEQEALQRQLDNRDKPLFMKPGHCAGDLVEAYKWNTLREEPGLLELDVHLPEQLLNPRRQLFGGFTGTYVDMAAIYTVRTLFADKPGFTWSSTVNMRIDYLQPVTGPRFRIRSEVLNDGRTTTLVATWFLDLAGNNLVYAITTLRKYTQAT